MNDTTTGKDIFITLQRVLTDMKLDLSKLISVTTDGASAMVGRERHMKDLEISHKIKKLHCIIHQEALCAKSLKLKEVMDVVVKNSKSNSVPWTKSSLIPAIFTRDAS